MSESNWTAMSKSQRGELFATLDEILWEKWDPIGARDFDDPRLEYLGYVSKILVMLLHEATSEEVAGRLTYFRTVSMGCPEDRESDRIVAGLCVETWHRAKNECLGQDPPPLAGEG